MWLGWLLQSGWPCTSLTLHTSVKHPELRSVGQVTMRGDVEYLDSCPNWAKLTQQEAGKEGGADSTEGGCSGVAVVCGCAWVGSSGLKTAVTAGFAEDPYADFQELQPTAVAYTYTCTRLAVRTCLKLRWSALTHHCVFRYSVRWLRVNELAENKQPSWRTRRDKLAEGSYAVLWRGAVRGCFAANTNERHSAMVGEEERRARKRRHRQRHRSHSRIQESRRRPMQSSPLVRLPACLLLSAASAVAAAPHVLVAVVCQDALNLQGLATGYVLWFACALGLVLVGLVGMCSSSSSPSSGRSAPTQRVEGTQSRAAGAAKGRGSRRRQRGGHGSSDDSDAHDGLAEPMDEGAGRQRRRRRRRCGGGGGGGQSRASQAVGNH